MCIRDRVYSRNLREPFGGNQILMVGDVFQLDPVVFTIIQEKASTEGMGDTKLKVKSAELIEGNVYGNQDVSKTIADVYKRQLLHQ